MNEMVYGNKEMVVLVDATYRGYRYVIINRMTHPCCYVDIKKAVPKKFVDLIDCHGGVTYYENYLQIGDNKNKGIWIGWDYMHACDAIGEGEGIHWNTEQLVEHCKSVIDQVCKRS